MMMAALALAWQTGGGSPLFSLASSEAHADGHCSCSEHGSTPAVVEKVGGGTPDINGNGPDFAYVLDGTSKYLIAARNLEAGRVIFNRVGGPLSDMRTRHSIQVREGVHMDSQGDLKYIDHSCDPNCQLEVVEPALSASALEKV